MASLDLDARRAEYGDGHDVTMGGQTWTLPAKFPIIVAQQLQAGQIDRAVATLFGEDAVPVVTPMLNDDDLNAILGELYGLDTPGDSAPPVVVPNGSKAPVKSRK